MNAETHSAPRVGKTDGGLVCCSLFSSGPVRPFAPFGEYEKEAAVRILDRLGIRGPLGMQVLSPGSCWQSAFQRDERK